MDPFVFISYSHVPEPDASYVNTLAAHLARSGVAVWFDHELLAGNRWVEVIRDRVDTCSALIVVMTPAAEQSVWVAREIHRAENLGRPLIPLLLAGRPFFRLAELQYEDVSTGRMPSAAFVAEMRQHLRRTVLRARDAETATWSIRSAANADPTSEDAYDGRGDHREHAAPQAPRTTPTGERFAEEQPSAGASGAERPTEKRPQWKPIDDKHAAEQLPRAEPKATQSGDRAFGRGHPLQRPRSTTPTDTAWNGPRTGSSLAARDTDTIAGAQPATEHRLPAGADVLPRRPARWPPQGWRRLSPAVRRWCLAAMLTAIMAIGAVASLPGVVVHPSAGATSPGLTVMPTIPASSASTSPPTASEPISTAAKQFVTEWLRRDRTASAWLAGLSPYATPKLVQALRGADPTAVPATRITGEPQLLPLGLAVLVPVDTGMVRLNMVPNKDRWLVDSVDWERS